MTLFAMAATPSLAQEQQNPLSVRNAGAGTCEQFVQVFSKPGEELTKTAFLQWIAGYTTAAARASNVVDVFPINDTMQLVQFVTLLCGEDPQRTLEAAVFESVTRLRPFWVSERPNRLTLTWNGRRTQYYEAAVRPLQEALVRLGFDIAVDGAYGNQTGAAIESIAQQIGIEAAPFPSGALLYVITRPAQ